MTPVFENAAWRFTHGPGYIHGELPGYSLWLTNRRYPQKPPAPYDAIGTGYALYDEVPYQIVGCTETGEYREQVVKTAKTRKTERFYKDRPLYEIRYDAMDALWLEDKIDVWGEPDDIRFVMHGMKDLVGMAEGKALWAAAEKVAGHNFGDAFIEQNGSTVDACTYRGYLIYGMVNQRTGEGYGFTFPTQIAVHDWKVWWDEPNRIAVEFFPYGRTGERAIFAVTGGREEVLATGRTWVESRAQN
jgi:hypothetical protein